MSETSGDILFFFRYAKLVELHQKTCSINTMKDSSTKYGVRTSTHTSFFLHLIFLLLSVGYKKNMKAT